MRRAGFSAVEVLVAAAGALLVVAALAALGRSSQRLAAREAEALRVREAARRILAAVAREIRRAGYEPIPLAAFDGATLGVAVAAADEIEIRAAGGDPADGRVEAGSEEVVRFYWNPGRGAPYQAIGGQIQPLAADVSFPDSALGFRYFDGCGAELRPPAGGSLADDARARIRRVDVSLALGAPPAIVVATSAALRNRPALCAPAS